MNKIIKKIQIPAIFMALFLIVPSISIAESPSATPSAAPATTNQGNAGVTSGNNSAPATTNQGNAGVTSGNDGAPATTNQGNGGVVGSNNQTPNNDGGSSSTGGSSRSGGRSGTRRSIVTAINPANCSYLNDYLSINSNNSEMEVIKLQAFLLNTEGLNVDINGKFDQKTFDAVKAFQKKYSSEILSPWGSSIPTGKVFYTTKKKINEIQCNSPFPLTAQQIYEIELYKNRPVVTAPVVTITPDLDVILETETSTTTSAVDSATTSIDDSNSTQPGVVIKAPITTRVYNFIKWLFAF